MKDIDEIINKYLEGNYLISGEDRRKMIKEISDKVVTINSLEIEDYVETNNVSHCPLCNSGNLHQYKLHHIHCKDCKEDFNKSCD